jgi:hypothetical protein
MTEPPNTPQDPINSSQASDAPGHDFTVPLPAELSDSRKLPRLATPHAGKFRLAFGMLCGIATAAVVVAVLVIANHTSNHSSGDGSPAWSEWSPSTTGTTGAQEIADYLAPFYRFSTAQQLDVITPIALTSATAAGTTTGQGLTVAVDTASASSTSSSSSLSLLTGSTVAYNVCGLGASGCDLAGTPSTSRMLLLRREALELALYTFRYLSTADNVLVVLPPSHTATKVGSGVTPAKSVIVAVLFVRAELKPLLSTPIDTTLAPDPPDLAQLASWSKSDEAGLVDEATARDLFSEQVEAQQEGGRLLVLTPLAPQ